MKFKIISIAVFLCCMVSISCNKVLEVPSTRLVGEINMWNTIADVRAGLMGVYGLERAALCDNDCYWLYGDLRGIQGRGGDFRSTERLDLQAISENNLTATYPVVEALSNWRRFYAVINAANVFLENAPKVLQRDPHYLPADLKLDIAHARLLRAFTYFYLVRLWGDVPLILSSHDGQFPNKPREKQEKVLAFIESELLATIPDLPVVYNGTQPEESRDPWYLGEWEPAKKHSAYAILAHVYAWEGKYADAAICAKWVLDNMKLPALAIGYRNQTMFFMNVDQMRQMFRGEWGNNQYNILWGFDHAMINGETTNSGCLEELTLAAPYVIKKALPDIYVPKDSVLSIFNELNDTRFYLNPATAAPNADRYFGAFDRTIPVFTKVFIIRDNNPPLNTITGPGSDGSMTSFGSSIVFSRPEDMELLLAEADAVLGNVADATTYLNAARVNRGLTSYDPAKNGSLIDAIFTERRKELMGEGQRWFDIIRYKKIKNNDPVFNTMIQNGGIYWPVAKALLAQNPLLVQTPFWNK